MSELTFLDSLDDEQTANAVNIAKKAKELGIDPRLAVTTAFVESELRHATDKGIVKSPKGAVGIMQVMPTTAEDIGYDRDELKDPNKNIEAGLKYLRQSLDRFNGDPIQAAAGYNAGYNHGFFTGKEKSLPEETIDYLRKIKNYGGFSPTPQEEVQAAEEKPAPVAEVKKQVAPASDEDYKRRMITGASAAAAAVPVGLAQDTLAAARGKFMSPPDVRAPAMPSNVGTPGEKWGRKVTGYVNPNVDTVTGQAEAWNRAKGSGKVSGSMSKNWGPRAPGQPMALVDRLIAQGAAPAQTTAQKIASGLESAGNLLNRVPKTIQKGVGAFGAGFDVADAAQRFQKGDYPGAAIAGAGALGSVASMVPHPITKAIGTGVGLASPLALSIYDRLHKQSQNNAQGALSRVDAMGNPLP